MMRKRRVRFHLLETTPQMQLPSVEGLLVGKRRGWTGRVEEYEIAKTQLIVSPEARPAELASRLLTIPADRVAFYEVL